MTISTSRGTRAEQRRRRRAYSVHERTSTPSANRIASISFARWPGVTACARRRSSGPQPSNISRTSSQRRVRRAAVRARIRDACARTSSRRTASAKCVPARRNASARVSACGRSRFAREDRRIPGDRGVIAQRRRGSSDPAERSAPVRARSPPCVRARHRRPLHVRRDLRQVDAVAMRSARSSIASIVASSSRCGCRPSASSEVFFAL